MKVSGPAIDWAAISPLVALSGGLCIVLLTGLMRSLFVRRVGVPILTAVTLGVTAGLAIWQWGENVSVVEGSLRIDDLALSLTLVFCAAGIATVLLSARAVAPRESGHGEYYALLLAAVLGMVVLASAQNLVTVFLGYEVLSIPLYVLCATELRREHSLESGLKYLIIGSVGSATLLYGLALLYGATGATDFDAIARALGPAGDARDDVLFLTSLALIVAGLAFKASIAPFHQWTPDVYEGAPTPITAFMAVATKAAAFGIVIRLFDVAVIGATTDWAPALAVLAATTIVVGNVGAIGQSSLKRLLAWSGVAQAGYMLAGVVVSTRLGVEAIVFYLFAYTVMNMAAFAVVVARERETGEGDGIDTLRGLGASRPWLAWPMTIAMLALAGLPGTVGFFGKVSLIEAAVDNEWAWLGVAIVLGSAISLAYYLRVVAAVWMRPPGEPAGELAVAPARPAIAGGSPEADDEDVGARRADAGGTPEPDDEPAARRADAGGTPEDAPLSVDAREATSGNGADPGPAPVTQFGDAAARVTQPEVVFVAVVCAAATVGFGLYPDPLYDVARDAGAALTGLL